MPEIKRRDVLKAGALGVAAAGAKSARRPARSAISSTTGPTTTGAAGRPFPIASTRGRSPITAPTPMRPAAKSSWRPRRRTKSSPITAWGSPSTSPATSARRAFPARRSSGQSKTWSSCPSSRKSICGRTGVRCRAGPASSTCPTGGKSPSMSRGSMTSVSASASCWRTRISRTRACPSS